MREIPNWLSRIQSSPLAAEGAALLSEVEDREAILEIKQSAVEKIYKAFIRGDIDEDCLGSMYITPAQLLVEVMGLTNNEPIIIRSRTVTEVLQQFPQVSNVDGTRNVPIGVEARLIPRPFFLNTNGPLLVSADAVRQELLIKTVQQANQKLNGKRISVLIDPTNAMLNKIWEQPNRKFIIIADAERTAPDDLHRIIELSKDIFYHRVIITASPNRNVILPRGLENATRLQYQSNEVYFTKIDQRGHQERYFPITPNL